MKFKTPELENQLNRCHKKLFSLLSWVDRYCEDKFNKDITITGVERSHQESIDIYVKQINPKTGKLFLPEEVAISPHETKPCRAIDLRSSDFTSDQCLHIQYAVNTNWIYDPDRLEKKCVLYHCIAGNAYHLHLQVTDKTVETVRKFNKLKGG